MTFEPVVTANHLSGRGPAWAIKFSSTAGFSARFSAQKDVRLVLGFYARTYNGRNPDVDVWVEREQVYQVIDLSGKRKKSAARSHVVNDEITNTRRRLKLTTGMENIVAEALGANLIVGKPATDICHMLFWMHLVEDDEGLSYLHRVLPRESAEFYVRQRLNVYTQRIETRDRDNGDEDVDPPRITEAISAAYGAISNTFEYKKKYPDLPFWAHKLGDRIKNRLRQYMTLCSAVDQVMLTDENEDRKHQLVADFVVHEAQDVDHAYAMIIATTDDTPLLGLRACQRLEAGTDTLLAKLVAYREQRPTKKQVLAVLRQHFKGIRL